jgi:hypothetical protein
LLLANHYSLTSLSANIQVVFLVAVIFALLPSKLIHWESRKASFIQRTVAGQLLDEALASILLLTPRFPVACGRGGLSQVQTAPVV